MKLNLPFITFLLFFITACTGKPDNARLPQDAYGAGRLAVRTESLDLFDQVRNRTIPVVMYYNKASDAHRRKQKVAIFNHGYGGTNIGYSFITTHLVSHGYFVISIQHDLPADEPLPTTGKLYEVRMPVWKRGVQSMLFAIDEIRKLKPYLDFQHMLLAGHSNGGDMAVLFAHEHAEQVEKVITLDNRRVPLPRTRKLQILSLRSRDQPADEGVLPTQEEQQRFGIRVIRLNDTTHNDMYDGATAQQKEEIRGYISEFLK